eukprot:scaffold14662_cov56-Cylindrotheca_fusiformis.AAC.1
MDRNSYLNCQETTINTMNSPIRKHNATWNSFTDNQNDDGHHPANRKHTRKLSSPSLRSLLSTPTSATSTKGRLSLSGRISGSMKNLSGLSLPLGSTSKSHHQGLDRSMQSPRNSAKMHRRRSSLGLGLTERSRRKAELKQQNELAYLVMAEFADCEV